MKKLLKILDLWPKYYITPGDLSPILKISKDALHSLLKRAVKENLLIRLKREFYLISSKIQKKKPEAFEIAQLLYGPSYISFESALNFHGWIPEAVFVINSACSKRTKKFENFLGIFTYYNIPISIFHIGVSSYHKELNEDKIIFLMADPWKALADYIYIKKRSWPNIIALVEDLRIELDIIRYSDLTLLQKLTEIYPNKRVRKTLNILLRNLKK
jgi:hypothetical protein